MFTSHVLALADKNPAIAKALVSLVGRAVSSASIAQRHTPHWLARELVMRTGAWIPVTARLDDGLRLAVPWGHEICAELLTTGTYEPQSQRVLKSLLRPGQTMVDIGAHVGVFTLLAARAVGPGGQVHSFEPDPRTIAWLRSNVRRNGLRNVSITAAAVSDHIGRETFYVGSDAAVSSLRAPRADLYRSREISVPVIDLSSYLKSHAVPRVDLVKIDAEGGELPALRMIHDLLNIPGRPALIVEFASMRQRAFGHSSAELAEYLLGCGYRLFRIAAEPVLQELAADVSETDIFNVLAVAQDPGSDSWRTVAHLASGRA
ncbi:MAG: FkbM family methyltransferase [Gammaproteobacteria bacterium]